MSRSWIDWETGSNNNNIINVILNCQLSTHSIHNAKLYYYEKKIRNLHLSTYHEIKSGHENCPAISLALEKQEERYLLSGGADGLIALYDLDSNQDTKNESLSNVIEPFNKVREHMRGVSSIQWYPDDSGIFISSSFDGQLLIWDTNAFTTAATFKFHAEGNTHLLKVYRASMCSNGNPIIACALDDSSIRLCDPRSGDCCQSLMGHRKAVMSVQWNPLHSHLIASASLDGTLKLWDIRKAGFSSAIRSFDWMQDNTASTRIFTDFYSNNKSNTSNLESKTKVPVKGAMTGLDWTKDSVAKAHESGIMSLRFTSCGHYILSSGNDRKIRLWDADNGKLIPSQYSSGCTSTLPYDIEIAQFSCSGDDVLIFPNGNDGNITLTQLHSSTGNPFLTLKGHLGMVHSLIYRSIHQQILSAAADGLIFLWDADNRCSSKLNKSSTATSTSKVFTYDEVEVESDWSGDEDDNNQSIIPSYKKCFIPPIIQQYIDDVKKTSSSSSSVSKNAVITPPDDNILSNVSTRIRNLFPVGHESLDTAIPDTAIADTAIPDTALNDCTSQITQSQIQKRMKSNFKKIILRKSKKY